MRMLNEDNTQKKDFNDLYDNLKKFIDYIKKNLDEDKVLKILLDKSKTNQQIIEELSGQIVGTTTDGALQLLSSARSAGESEKIPDTSTDIVAHGGENQYSAYVVGTHMYNILKAIDEDSIFKKEIKEDFSQKLKIFVAAPNINTAKDLFYFLSKNKMSPSYIFTALSEIIGEDKLIKVMTDLCNELYSPVKKNYIINTDTEKATAALLLDMSHYIYKLRGEDNMYSTTSFNLLEKIRVIVLENKKFTNRRDILIDMIIKKIENISKEMDFDYIVNILGILFDKKDLNTRDSIEGIIRILNPVQTRKLVNVLIKTKNSIPPQNTSNPLREWIDRILNEITQVKDSKRLNYGKRVKS